MKKAIFKQIAGRLALCASLAVFIAGCSRSPEAREAKSLERGKSYLQAQDYPRAILEFKAAVQAKPRDAEAYYQLGLAYATASDPLSAASCFRKAIDLNPKHAGAQLRAAQYLALSDNKAIVENARKRAQEVGDADPGNIEARSTLAFTELRLGNSENAVKHLQEALAKVPDDLKSAVLLMRIKVSQGDLSGGEQVLKNAVASAPRSAEAAVALGRLYMALRRMPEAELQMRRALQLQPKYGPALLDLGMIQLHTGKKEQAEQTFRQVAALPQKIYKPVHAIFLMDQGSKDAAIAEFERLYNLDPADRMARTRLVTAYLVAGRGPLAQELLNNVLKKNGKDTDALLQRSEILISLGKYSNAENDLSLALRFRPESGQAHALLAQVYAGQGLVIRERKELTEALRLNPELLPVRLELAHVLISSDEASAALEVLDHAFSAEKNNPNLLLLQNWALLRLNRLAEVRKGIDKGLAISRTPEFLLQDGVLKIALKNYPAARASLEDSLKQNPEYLPALRMLAQLYRIQKQDAAGLQRVRDYVSQRPKSAPMQYFLGDLLLSDGKASEARTAYSAARSADSHYYQADLALAKLDVSDGKLDAARQHLKGLVEARPNDPDVWMYVGWLESNQNNGEQAIQAFRKVTDLDPGNARALNNLAYLLANHPNQLDEALQYAQKAKELSPEEPGIDDTLGWIFYQKGLYQSAVTYLEMGVKRGGQPATKYHLAMAYVKLSDKRGQEMLTSLFQVAPNLPEAQMARRVLAEGKSGLAR